MSNTGQITITTKLYLLVACAILPALLIILFTGIAERELAIRNAMENLENFTNAMAELQGEKTRHSKMFLRTMAAMPEVRGFDLARCEMLFKRILGENPDVSNIALTDGQGLVAASGAGTEKAVDLSDRAVFRLAVQTKRFSAGDFAMGRLARGPIFTYGIPIAGDDGGFKGVLVCCARLSPGGGCPMGARLPQDSRLVFADRRGVLLCAASQTPAKLLPPGTKLLTGNWRVMSEAPVEAGHFTGTRPDGVKALFYFRKLRLYPEEPPYMTVFTNIPVAEVLKASSRGLWRNLVLLALAALLALLIARMLGQALVGWWGARWPP